MMTKSYYLYELVIKTFFFKITEIVKYIKIDIFKFSGFVNFFSFSYYETTEIAY